MARFLEVAALAVGLAGLPVLAGETTDGRRELRIEYDAAPTVTRRAATQNSVDGEYVTEQFVGHYSGVVVGETSDLFEGSSVTCEFEGSAAPGRVSSSNVEDIEDVAGRCLFTAENGDAAVAEWACRTGALMTSDARCEGKVVWVQGSGKFAGITGEGRFHSDLFLHPAAGYARWRGNWRIAIVA